MSFTGRLMLRLFYELPLEQVELCVCVRVTYSRCTLPVALTSPVNVICELSRSNALVHIPFNWRPNSCGVKRCFNIQRRLNPLHTQWNYVKLKWITNFISSLSNFKSNN